MLKAELINEAQKDEYKQICKRMLFPLWADLYQELMLILLEYPEDRTTRIESVAHARFFIVGILCNMVKSTNSPFYFKYRQPVKVDAHELVEFEPELVDTDISVSTPDIHSAVDRLYPFDKHILYNYVEAGSLRKAAQKTNIPVGIIRSSINSTKKTIKYRMKPIEVLLITTEENNGLKYHRQVSPHVRLAKTNPDFRITEMKGRTENGVRYESTIDSMTDEELRQFDIVYYLRQISFAPGNVKRLTDRTRSLGITTILDIDDYWRLNAGHMMYQVYKEKDVVKETEESIRSVDHVITTTDEFAEMIRPLNDHVTVLPNCVNPDDDQFQRRTIESPRVRFGWIGGTYHRADLQAIAPNFCKVSKDLDIRNRYQFCLGGYNTSRGPSGEPNEYMHVETYMTCNYEFRYHDATYMEYLNQYTPTQEHISYDKPYRRLWGRPVDHYGEMYNEIDVSLVPLLPNKFNKCKSELKLVEAGAMGKAVIVSDVEPYNKWIKDGVNGLLVKPSRNSIDWALAIKRLTLDAGLRTSLAAGLEATVKEHFDMDKHNVVREQLYKSLVKR